MPGGSFDFTVVLVMAGMALSDYGTGRVNELKELSIKKIHVLFLKTTE